MPIRGYGSADTRALQSGWTTVAPDVKTRLVDDAIAYIQKKQGVREKKLKNVSIDIDEKNLTADGVREVVIKAKVDMVIVAYMSTRDLQVIVSSVAGETVTPENVFYTNRPALAPIILLKGKQYKFTMKGEASTPSDLLLAGLQVGDIPSDLVQYTIESDTGVAP